MELPALVELLNTLKTAGVELYCLGDLTIKFAPTPAAKPAGISAGVAMTERDASQRPAPREPLPPELAPFMTPDLAAELTATLED